MTTAASWTDTLLADLSEAKTAAALEAHYLLGKTQGFSHPADVEEQIEIMRASREEVKSLRERISKITHNAKDRAEDDAKAAETFTAMIGKKEQHPKLSQVLEHFASCMTQLSSHYFELFAAMEGVNDEWKAMENHELHDIRIRQDQLNRALTDSTYFRKNAKTDRAAIHENKYQETCKSLVRQIHELRMKKEEAMPAWLLRTLQAELVFHRKAGDTIQHWEGLIRKMGRVEAIEYQVPEKFKIGTISEKPLLAYHNDTSSPASPEPKKTTRAAAALPPYPVAQAAPVVLPSAQALYPFSGSTNRELSFGAGDIMTIISQDPSGWWMAEMGGQQGLVPHNYIKLL